MRAYPDAMSKPIQNFTRYETYLDAFYLIEHLRQMQDDSWGRNLHYTPKFVSIDGN